MSKCSSAQVFMKIERFEDLLAWQEASSLAVEIYRLFSSCRDYSFRDQIQRAAVSISNNLAEGFDRETKNDLRHFFVIAKSSCAEVRSMLHISGRLKYIPPEDIALLMNQSNKTSALIKGFIASIDKKN